METLNMRKVIDYFLVIVALVIAVIFYFNFDLEEILWERRVQVVINVQDIKADTTVDYTGLTAGEGISSLTNAQEWKNTLSYSDYVTVVPVSVQKTSVYSLAKWIEYYTKRATGTAGRRLAEVEKRLFDYSASHSPYYIIELQDGTRILAQMNRGIANQIKEGKSITLPLGQKIGMTQTAKSLLAPLCEELNVSTDGVLYTIDNYWAAQNADKIKYGKYGIALVLWLFLSVVFQSAAEKILVNMNVMQES